MSDEYQIHYQVRLWKCPKCGEINESPRSTCERCGAPEPKEASER